MTATSTDRLVSPGPIDTDLLRTARTTGLLYLGLALTGALGNLVVRGQLFDADHPWATLANLMQHEGLARVGIALELGTVLTQALTALWFYRLFRRVDSFTAGCLAAFGLVNAVAILASAAFLATALDISNDASLTVTGGAAPAGQLAYVVSGHLWGVGGLFFGLRLIPMGLLVLRSSWMPRALGWVLVVGGVGYVLSAFVAYLFSGSEVAVQLLAVPATIGELWILGYLILFGVREHAPAR